MHARIAGELSRPQRRSECTSSAPALRPPLLIRPLSGARVQLELIAAVAAVAHVALGCQAADVDRDVAFLIQRCIADEIGRQIEEIDAIIAIRSIVRRKSPSLRDAR
ncbi:MAG TPA: hypothetical protein VHB68_20120 [Steroidobacteraceae bacterium]|nr:hypothetical protein [Steroidobacteraceae bacterium]